MRFIIFRDRRKLVRDGATRTKCYQALVEANKFLKMGLEVSLIDDVDDIGGTMIRICEQRENGETWFRGTTEVFAEDTIEGLMETIIQMVKFGPSLQIA